MVLASSCSVALCGRCADAQCTALCTAQHRAIQQRYAAHTDMRDSQLPGDFLCNFGSHLILEHSSWKVGILGLVEEEWLATLSSINPASIQFEDAHACAQRIINDHLRPAGVDIVIALTHMRYPNDVALAEAVPQIDVILGGHDHGFAVTRCGDAAGGNLLVKSGTDYRDMAALVLLHNAAHAGLLAGTPAGAIDVAEFEADRVAIPAPGGSEVEQAAMERAAVAVEVSGLGRLGWVLWPVVEGV